MRISIWDFSEWDITFKNILLPLPVLLALQQFLFFGVLPSGRPSWNVMGRLFFFLKLPCDSLAVRNWLDRVFYQCTTTRRWNLRFVHWQDDRAFINWFWVEIKLDKLWNSWFFIWEFEACLQVHFLVISPIFPQNFVKRLCKILR